MKAKSTTTGVDPYVGPRSFLPGEPIYGRDQEIFDLTNSLMANHVVLLHALSGAGKTSLIQAGLIPALEKHNFRVMPVVRINREPDPDEIPDSVEYNRYQLSTLLSLEQDKRKERMLSPEKLVDLPLAQYLQRRRLKAESGKPRLTRSLLIFDQFEEILNLENFDHDQRKDFFAWLMPVLYDVGYWALFSIRDDYVGGLEPYLDYFPDRLASRYRLEFLDETAAFDAIRNPAIIFGVDFKEEAAKELVDELRTITIQDLEGTHQDLGRYVEPIQLQVVCLKLWKSPRPDKDQISRDDVRKFGNVDTALSDYYDNTLDRFWPDDPRRQRALRDWIESQLITEEELRSQSLQVHLSKFGLDKEMVDSLISTYLVRAEERLNATWYELAHDRLVKPILQANRRWREQNLASWQLAAERWVRSGKPAEFDLFLASEKLDEILADLDPSKVNATDRQFLVASDNAIKQAKRVEISYWADPERLKRVKLGTNLDEVGWGVIFSQDASEDLRAALKELRDHRRGQAGKNRANYYREFFGPEGYQPGDSAQDFLRRKGALSGLANPENMPYYLLIVGSPAEIPFEFQYGLDEQYAVGRLYFEHLGEYQSYARSVSVCEGGTVLLPNTAAVFSPRFPDDSATRQVYENFAQPLVKGLAASQHNWRVDMLGEGQATKLQLHDLMGGWRTPSVLMAASWGAGYPHLPENEADLGAVMTAEWPGPQADGGAVQSAHYFSAGDIDPYEDRLLGLIAFLSSAYSAGVPKHSDFNFQSQSEPLVKEPVLARLPQRLLGHPHGGALAVIAHVDMIWTASFTDTSGASEVGIYQELIERLMQGFTAGAAMELLNQRYTQLTALLKERLQGIFFYEQKTDQARLHQMMTRALDARNYILLGDPAVRLPVDPTQPYEEPSSDWARPTIQTVVPMKEKVKRQPPPPAVEQPEPELADELWYASGIVATTGEFATAALPASQIVLLMQASSLRSQVRQDLGSRRWS